LKSAIVIPLALFLFIIIYFLMTLFICGIGD
jgi:hypothetical protein